MLEALLVNAGDLFVIAARGDFRSEFFGQ